MVKEGPCCHCGIENTPLWRNGPPEKPVLCNACGSRWRVRGTLDDYIPKHALFAKEESDNSGSHSPSTGNVINLENTDEQSGTNFENVPRRKRSSIDQVVLSPIERFHKQLYGIAHAHPEVFLKEPVTEDVLIQQINSMMSTPKETLLGVKLLSLPPKLVEPTESVSSSNMKAKNAFLLAKNGGVRGESSSTRDITDPT